MMCISTKSEKESSYFDWEGEYLAFAFDVEWVVVEDFYVN
jgi:hypothetical protein